MNEEKKRNAIVEELRSLPYCSETAERRLDLEAELIDTYRLDPEDVESTEVGEGGDLPDFPEPFAEVCDEPACWRSAVVITRSLTAWCRDHYKLRVLLSRR